MTKSLFIIYAASALLVLIMPIGGAAQQTSPAGAVVPPSQATVTIHVSKAAPPAPVQSHIDPVVPVTWDAIKDLSFEMRDQFLAGLERLTESVNAEINELAARRAADKEPADAKTLDLALQEMRYGQFFLKTSGEAVRIASPEQWNERKAKVGLAWAAAQKAYAKINPPPSA